MRKLIVFMFVAMSAFAFNANAEIGGKKVIFIHGNQPAAFDRDITQAEREANARAQAGDIPVSYTHLTLPTILLV